MDHIEMVVYINLRYRIDRKRKVEEELRKVFPPEKIVRFNAIQHEKGGIGCSMSHIGALELAISKKWKNVLIVEDDLQWMKFKQCLKVFERLVKTPHDVIVLSGHGAIYNPVTYKLESCFGRTAYLVEEHYYQTLLDNFKTGLDLLNVEFTHDYRGDRFWNRIQKRDNWYIVMPALCIQAPSFSDIEQKHVNYTSYLKSQPKNGI